MAKTIVRAEESFKINNVGEAAGVSDSILPMSPWVEIQFRTNIISDEVNLRKATPSEKNEWTTVSFRKAAEGYTPPMKSGDESSLQFDNFFDNITLEDNGGVVKCNMQLFDKDLERLENIVIKSLIATKGGNDVAARALSDVPAKSILEFMPNPSSNINFRLRFGYSDPGGDQVFRPALASSPEWKSRTSSDKSGSMYAKSPWLYFMMMGMTFNLQPKGLIANIEGISMSNSYLDKTKIIKRFALMKGTPQKLFTKIAENIYKSTGGRVQIVDGILSGNTSDSMVGKPVISEGDPQVGINVDYGTPSDLPIQWSVLPKEGSDAFPDSLSEDDKKDLEDSAKWLNISLSLGGEPRYEIDENGERTSKIINEFMSLKELLNDFVSKVPSILRNKDTNKYITDAEKVKEILDNENNTYDPTVFEPIPYTYSINEQTWDLGDTASSTGGSSSSGAQTDTVVVIRFFYRRLDNTKQGFVRSYDYMNSPKTLISGFNVKNKLDFIQLNQSIIVKGNDLDVMLSAPSGETDDSTGSSAANVTENFKDQLQSDQFTLVNRIVENNGDSGKDAVANKVIQNMNEGIFYGNIEILGDPFYLFDANLQPYQYYIKINVYRNYNEYSQSTSNNRILNQSYLSGYYLIKKITHTLGISGFKTTLDVQRYPTTGIEDLS